MKGYMNILRLSVDFIVGCELLSFPAVIVLVEHTFVVDRGFWKNQEKQTVDYWPVIVFGQVH